MGGVAGVAWGGVDSPRLIVVDLKPIDDEHDGGEVLEVTEPLCAVFRRHLKSLGQKYTPERAQILDVLLKMDDIFEAERLLEEMRGREYRVSKATVYRTIKLLQEAGIIQQVLLDAEQAHYQLVYGKSSSDLLINVETNEVVAVDVPELSEICRRVCAEHGLRLEGHRFQIFATPGDEGTGEGAG